MKPWEECVRTEYIPEYEYFAHQIHTISGTRHKADVTDSIQRAQFVELQTFMHEVNGHKFHSSESTIDAADKFIYS